MKQKARIVFADNADETKSKSRHQGAGLLKRKERADACTLEHTRHQQTVHKTVPDNNPRLGGRGLGYSPGPRTNPLEVRGRLALCAIYRPHILAYTPVGLTSPDRGDSIEG